MPLSCASCLSPPHPVFSVLWGASMSVSNHRHDAQGRFPPLCSALVQLLGLGSALSLLDSLKFKKIICVHTHTHTHTCAHTRMHAHTRTHIHAHAHTGTSAHPHKHLSILLPGWPFLKHNPMSFPIKPSLPKSAATLEVGRHHFTQIPQTLSELPQYFHSPIWPSRALGQ